MELENYGKTMKINMQRNCFDNNYRANHDWFNSERIRSLIDRPEFLALALVYKDTSTRHTKFSSASVITYAHFDSSYKVF